MGLMNFLQKPGVTAGLGGLFAQMSNAGRGGNFDLSGTFDEMEEMRRRQMMQEQMQALMRQGNYNPQQIGLMQAIGPEGALPLMAEQAFPKPGDPKRYNVGGTLVDADGNEIYTAPEEEPKPIRVGDDLVVPDGEGGFRKVYGSERKMGPDVTGEGKIRKEWTSLVDNYRTVHDAYGRVQASVKEPSAAGDLSLIFNYMKMLDPGSVVRESEFATAAASGSYGERIQGLVQLALSGKRLSDDIRQDFVNRTEALYERANKQYEADRGRFRNIAEQYGFNPERTVPDFSDLGEGGEIKGPAALSDEELMRQLGWK